MRLTLAALALLATVATASAGTTCHWVGNYYYCNNSDGTQTSCHYVGQYLYCN